MKKTIFALFAILLVLLLAACDEPGDDDVVTPDGKPMVTITINIDNGGTSRALSPTVGFTNADYFEVIFHDGTDYYQVEWGGAGPGSITIPPADYGAIGKDAILFAGKNNTTPPSPILPEKTLLGIGVITGSNGGGGTQEVTPTTNQVTFTVTSLVNNVTNVAGTSTFKITGPTVDAVGGFDYDTTATTSATTMPVPIAQTVGALHYPVFPIPAYGYPTSLTTPAVETISATYTITTIPQYAKVITAGAWDVTVAGMAADTESAAVGTITPTAVAATPAWGTAGTALTAASYTFSFTMTLAGTGTGGLAGVLIDVPVHALVATASKKAPGYTSGATVTWKIRGGSDLATPDGIAGNGAAVLLGVGTHGRGNVTISIPNPVSPWS